MGFVYHIRHSDAFLVIVNLFPLTWSAGFMIPLSYEALHIQVFTSRAGLLPDIAQDSSRSWCKSLQLPSKCDEKTSITPS